MPKTLKNTTRLSYLNPFRKEKKTTAVRIIQLEEEMARAKERLVEARTRANGIISQAAAREARAEEEAAEEATWLKATRAAAAAREKEAAERAAAEDEKLYSAGGGRRYKSKRHKRKSKRHKRKSQRRK